MLGTVTTSMPSVPASATVPAMLSRLVLAPSTKTVSVEAASSCRLPDAPVRALAPATPISTVPPVEVTGPTLPAAASANVAPACTPTALVAANAPPFTKRMRLPVITVEPPYVLWPVRVCVPLPFHTVPPVPETTPPNVVLLLLVPEVSVALPSVTELEPASEPMVALWPARSSTPLSTTGVADGSVPPPSRSVLVVITVWPCQLPGPVSSTTAAASPVVFKLPAPEMAPKAKLPAVVDRLLASVSGPLSVRLVSAPAGDVLARVGARPVEVTLPSVIALARPPPQSSSVSSSTCTGPLPSASATVVMSALRPVPSDITCVPPL